MNINIAYITFQGGLGNQMFQYVFLKYIETFGYKVFVDKSLYNKTKMHNGFILDKVFDSEIQFTEDSIFLLNNKFLKKIYEFGIFKKKVISEVNYDFKVLKKYSEIRFIGYWQSEKFIGDIYKNINSFFEFKKRILSLSCLSILVNIENSNSVAIHIRKGDYSEIKNSKIFGLCSSDYYKKAIIRMHSLLNVELKYYIFSDDLKYAKSLLGDELAYNYVDINNESEELFLMHKCKHQIIANSTFSWWGATLNKNDNKVIICPFPWYDNPKTENIFIPTKWIQLSKK